MKIGIIDIGTNSVRLFIPNKEELISSKKYMEITRIGEGVNEKRMLSELAMNRTIDGIKKLIAICKKNNIDKIYAMATSAVRDAANKEDFIGKVYKETGIHIEVLSGEEEARMGYVGVVKGLSDIEQDNYLIIDIGGGSTELIEIKNGNLVKMKSFDIGAVRLTEMFKLSNPPKRIEIDAMKDYIDVEIEGYLKNVKATAIGIGGTITTISSIKNQMAEYERKIIHESVIDKDDIDNIFNELIAMTNDDRKNVVGLDILRADIINAGILILQRILLMIESEYIIVSDYDNLEGYYFEKNNVDKDNEIL